MKFFLFDKSANVQKFLCVFAFRNKYDLASNKIVKEIFGHIVKDKIGFSREFPEFDCNISVTIESIDADYIEIIKGFEYRRFGISAYNTGNFYNNKIGDSKIIIDIILANGFSSKDYEGLNYSLYECIRHELEHIDTFKSDGKPDEEYGILSKNVFESIPSNSPEKLLEHCNLISKYFLHPQEISSYAKSIYFISKKKHQDFKKTIEEAFNRTFFNNNSENIILGEEDKRISSIVEKTRRELIQKINSNFPNSKIVMRSLPY